MGVTLRKFMEHHNIKPESLLDAPIGKAVSSGGWTVSISISVEHVGGLGEVEIVACRILPEKDD